MFSNINASLQNNADYLKTSIVALGALAHHYVSYINEITYVKSLKVLVERIYVYVYEMLFGKEDVKRESLPLQADRITPPEVLPEVVNSPLQAERVSPLPAFPDVVSSPLQDRITPLPFLPEVVIDIPGDIPQTPISLLQVAEGEKKVLQEKRDFASFCEEVLGIKKDLLLSLSKKEMLTLSFIGLFLKMCRESMPPKEIIFKFIHLINEEKWEELFSFFNAFSIPSCDMPANVLLLKEFLHSFKDEKVVLKESVAWVLLPFIKAWGLEVASPICRKMGDQIHAYLQYASRGHKKKGKMTHLSKEKALEEIFAKLFNDAKNNLKSLIQKLSHPTAKSGLDISLFVSQLEKLNREITNFQRWWAVRGAAPINIEMHLVIAEIDCAENEFASQFIEEFMNLFSQFPFDAEKVAPEILFTLAKECIQAYPKHIKRHSSKQVQSFLQSVYQLCATCNQKFIHMYEKKEQIISSGKKAEYGNFVYLSEVKRVIGDLEIKFNKEWKFYQTAEQLKAFKEYSSSVIQSKANNIGLVKKAGKTTDSYLKSYIEIYEKHAMKTFGEVEGPSIVSDRKEIVKILDELKGDVKAVRGLLDFLLVQLIPMLHSLTPKPNLDDSWLDEIDHECESDQEEEVKFAKERERKVEEAEEVPRVCLRENVKTTSRVLSSCFDNPLSLKVAHMREAVMQLYHVTEDHPQTCHDVIAISRCQHMAALFSLQWAIELFYHFNNKNDQRYLMSWISFFGHQALEKAGNGKLLQKDQKIDFKHCLKKMFKGLKMDSQNVWGEEHFNSSRVIRYAFSILSDRDFQMLPKPKGNYPTSLLLLVNQDNPTFKKLKTDLPSSMEVLCDLHVQINELEGFDEVQEDVGEVQKKAPHSPVKIQDVIDRVNKALKYVDEAYIKLQDVRQKKAIRNVRHHLAGLSHVMRLFSNCPHSRFLSLYHQMAFIHMRYLCENLGVYLTILKDPKNEEHSHDLALYYEKYQLGKENQEFLTLFKELGKYKEGEYLYQKATREKSGVLVKKLFSTYQQAASITRFQDFQKQGEKRVSTKQLQEEFTSQLTQFTSSATTLIETHL